MLECLKTEQVATIVSKYQVGPLYHFDYRLSLVKKERSLVSYPTGIAVGHSASNGLQSDQLLHLDDGKSPIAIQQHPRTPPLPLLNRMFTNQVKTIHTPTNEPRQLPPRGH